MNNKVLITGGLGFIGSFLTERLVSEGYHVEVVDDLSTGSIENKFFGPIYHYTTVSKFCELYEKQFDIIFHLANNSRIARSFEFPRETLMNNYESTLSILEYIRKNCPSAKLFFASSSTTNFTDRFNNPYTFSKYSCDELLHLYKMHFNVDFSIIKFYNVYGSFRERNLGEYTTVIRKFKELVIENKPLTVYDGTRSRDFTHIDDTIDALSLILNKNMSESLYEIGSGKSYTISEIAEAFNHPIEYQPDKRKYELQTTLCEPNIPGWKAKKDVIQHVKDWKQRYMRSRYIVNEVNGRTNTDD